MCPDWLRDGGRDVLHCVYCHGWEVRDRAIGVLGSFHQALLFRQMSKDVTLFLHEGAELTEEQWEHLAGLGVGVVEGEVGGLVVDEERDRLAGGAPGVGGGGSGGEAGGGAAVRGTRRFPRRAWPGGAGAPDGDR
ncbi:hypothetical protein GCM10020295_19260 [Streptomyces cinereospinus]